MTTFRERQKRKVLSTAVGIAGIAVLIWTTVAWLRPLLVDCHPLLFVGAVTIELAVLSALGSDFVYHYQAAGSMTPGGSLTEDLFRERLKQCSPFVLYLRNFASETGATASPSRTVATDRPHLMWIPLDYSLMKIALYESFSKQYWLVAFENRQGDTVPYFDTVLCEHDTWRETVALALKRATLVIVAAEQYSPSLADEIRLVSEGAVDRTWVIYSESLIAQCTALADLVQRVRWKSRVPESQRFRTYKALSLPDTLAALIRNDAAQ